MKLSIRYISLIVSIIYLIENTGLNCPPSASRVKRDALRPISSAIPFDGPTRPGEVYPTVIKGKTEHTIAGIDHFKYSPEIINKQIEGKDKIISEGFRYRRHSLTGIIYHAAMLPLFAIERIYSVLSGKRRYQGFYLDKLIEGENDILTLDVFFRRPTPYAMKLAIFNVLCIITVLAMVLGFTYFPWLIIPAAVLLALTAIYKIFLAQLFDSAINIIDDDFRELVHATKLAYLPELFEKSDLKTVTVTGRYHQQGIVKYLEDDEARQERWQEFAADPWLRLRLRRYLDIERSMEICRKTKETKRLEVIGTIAELPGPKQLIEAMRFKSKPPTRADQIAAAIILILPPVLIVFVIIAILIKFSSKGPVFFKQARVGYNGETIMVSKFRTWTDEAEDAKRKLTTIGYIIGALRLDEWAQLFNIIKREMKFFGPRPLLPSQMSAGYKRRILSMVWPGIVSRSALIRARHILNGLPAIDTVEYDEEDAVNYSFLYNTALAISAFIVMFKIGRRVFIDGERNSIKDRILNTVVNNRGHLRISPRARPNLSSPKIVASFRRAFEIGEQVNIDPVPDEAIVQAQGPELNIPIKEISPGIRPADEYASVTAPTDAISEGLEIGEQAGIAPVSDELMVQPKGPGTCSAILFQARVDIAVTIAA